MSSTESLFAGKVVMISGACGGFGAALVQTFAAQGARLSLTDMDLARLEATAAGCGAETVLCAGDISDAETSQRWMAATLARYGRVDVAINNAGVVAPFARIVDTPDDSAAQIMAVDALGVFYALKQQLIAMDAQRPRGGAIVNIASAAGLVGAAGLSAYAAAKHAVIGLTKTAAIEHARRGVRVNAVCPSFARTAMVADNLDANDDEAEVQLVRGIPMGRLAEVDEVVRAVIFACDAQNSFMTGQSLSVDGGLTAY